MIKNLLLASQDGYKMLITENNDNIDKKNVGEFNLNSFQRFIMNYEKEVII